MHTSHCINTKTLEDKCFIAITFVWVLLVAKLYISTNTELTNNCKVKDKILSYYLIN